MNAYLWFSYVVGAFVFLLWSEDLADSLSPKWRRLALLFFAAIYPVTITAAFAYTAAAALSKRFRVRLYRNRVFPRIARFKSVGFKREDGSIVGFHRLLKIGPLVEAKDSCLVHWGASSHKLLIGRLTPGTYQPQAPLCDSTEELLRTQEWKV